MNVTPGQTFEWLIDGFATGIGSTGTAALGVRIRDGAGANFLARTTSGIVEDVTVGTNAVYRKSLTAPTTAGQYWLIADNGATTTTQELVVTFSAASAPAGSIYITRDQLKVTLELEDTTYADDDIDVAVAAASRAIDGYKNTRFYPTTETRYYTAQHGCELVIDDANAILTVEVDQTGDGVYETTWTVGDEYALAPANAALTGEPYRKIVLRSQAGARFPFYRDAVKVTGSFGWAEAPLQVTQAAKILAARYLRRARETPYGILTVVGDAVAAARLGRIDPDVAFLLDSVNADPPMLLA